MIFKEDKVRPDERKKKIFKEGKNGDQRMTSLLTGYKDNERL